VNHKITTDKNAALELEQLQDKLLGYPLKGTHVGKGPHVLMQESWTGVGSVPAGWSSYRNSSIEHPVTKGTWATPIDAKDSAALVVDTKLTTGEKATLSAAVATAAPLPSDWFPEDK